MFIKHQAVGLVATALLLMSPLAVHAEFVKDSYIITFTPPAQGKVPLVLPPQAENRGKIAFLEPTSGQTRADLARKMTAQLGFQGKVVNILAGMNAVHVNMNAEEAKRLRKHGRVFRIEQGVVTTSAGTTTSWALDRLDEPTPYLDSDYNTAGLDGSGRVIYVIDTGINLNTLAVRHEFNVHPNCQNTGTPATDNCTSRIIPYFDINDPNAPWDINTGGPRDGVYANDCHSHGTVVASAIGSNSFGVARGAEIRAVKITGASGDECGTTAADSNLEAGVIQWLADNESAGTIVNWSRGIRDDGCDGLDNDQQPLAKINTTLEAAMKNAHDAGIIIVVAAHNDGCDTADYSPTRIPEVFVVGGTSKDRIASHGEDEIFAKGNGKSRTGSNISVFAPAEAVELINHVGTVSNAHQGTSLATGYISGLIATACESSPSDCDNPVHPLKDNLYEAIRVFATTGTVKEVGGASLPSNTNSRFVWKNW